MTTSCDFSGHGGGRTFDPDTIWIHRPDWFEFRDGMTMRDNELCKIVTDAICAARPEFARLFSEGELEVVSCENDPYDMY